MPEDTGPAGKVDIGRTIAMAVRRNETLNRKEAIHGR